MYNYTNQFFEIKRLQGQLKSQYSCMCIINFSDPFVVQKTLFHEHAYLDCPKYKEAIIIV